MWNYDRSQYDPESTFTLVPEGLHKVRIDSVKPAVSSTGRDMWKIAMNVAGHPKAKVFYNLVFMEEQPEITNQNLGLLFDSFGIQEGDMDHQGWVGAIGAVQVAHEIYKGKLQARVSSILTKARQAEAGMEANDPAQAPGPEANSALPF